MQTIELREFSLYSKFNNSYKNNNNNNKTQIFACMQRNSNFVAANEIRDKQMDALLRAGERATIRERERGRERS